MNLALIFFELLLVISNLFIGVQFINSVLIFTVGMMVFLKSKYDTPFLNTNMSQAWIILSCLQAWTGIMLLLSYVSFTTNWA